MHCWVCAAKCLRWTLPDRSANFGTVRFPRGGAAAASAGTTQRHTGTLLESISAVAGDAAMCPNAGHGRPIRAHQHWHVSATGAWRRLRPSLLATRGVLGNASCCMNWGACSELSAVPLSGRFLSNVLGHVDPTDLVPREPTRPRLVCPARAHWTSPRERRPRPSH